MDEIKKQWILNYMLDHVNKDEFIDITAEPFVNAFVDEFSPVITERYVYGTPKVPEINKLLAELYKEGKVWRYRHYCDWYKDGYPRWFYIYKLNDSQYF